MERKTKNWLLIILGVVILLVVLGVVAVVGFGYYMYRQMNVTTSTSGDLEQQFTEIQSRFSGQVPYVEGSFVDDESNIVVHHELEKATRTKLQYLHVAIYDPREHRVIQMRLPFWLLRLGGNNPINLRGHTGLDFGGASLKVTTEDLERRGPGLILDTKGRRDEHIIAWSE